MNDERFVSLIVISTLVCLVSMVSIIISKSQASEVIAIRRAIPQLTTSNSMGTENAGFQRTPSVRHTIP
jgi:hypothetical protein